MSTKKRMMILGAAAILIVSLLGGCGNKPSDSASAADAAQVQEDEPIKPSLDDPEQIKTLEEQLVANFDQVSAAEVVHEESEYHIKLTLKSSEQSINDELQDTIISKIVQSYIDLTEDQIAIELQEE